MLTLMVPPWYIKSSLTPACYHTFNVPLFKRSSRFARGLVIMIQILMLTNRYNSIIFDPECMYIKVSTGVQFKILMFLLNWEFHREISMIIQSCFRCLFLYLLVLLSGHRGQFQSSGALGTLTLPARTYLQLPSTTTNLSTNILSTTNCQQKMSTEYCH